MKKEIRMIDYVCIDLLSYDNKKTKFFLGVSVSDGPFLRFIWPATPR